MLAISANATLRGPALSRGELLRAGLVTAGCLGLPELLSGRSTATDARRKDTAVIQLWLGGGPSHLDMYDLKPEAPAEIRGPFKPIATNVPGTQICELLPLQAKLMDTLSIVRSLHHATDDHAAGMHWMVTGQPVVPTAPDVLTPTHPSLGSVVAHERGPNQPGMAPYVHIHPDSMGFPIFPRIHGPAFLGARYAPLVVDYARKVADMNRATLDNLIGKPEFTGPSLALPVDISTDRLAGRDQLRRGLGELHQSLGCPAASRLDEFQRQALALVSSDAARNAFDLEKEDAATRDRYGRNSWGQGLLLCRRLVEAGVTFVTLNTDSFSGQWDTHGNQEATFKEMLPVYDQMLTALVQDLIDRGLYERVLVVVWGEFGRTPKINGNGGRDHWGRAAFVLLGGGGVPGGRVIGSTNPRGEEPQDDPHWPTDVLATIYRVLGIDCDGELHDSFGRPYKLLAGGQPIADLL
jgi:hypothetical protein